MTGQHCIDIGAEHRPIADLGDVHILAPDIHLDHHGHPIDANGHVPGQKVQVRNVPMEPDARREDKIVAGDDNVGVGIAVIRMSRAELKCEVTSVLPQAAALGDADRNVPGRDIVDTNAARANLREARDHRHLGAFADCHDAQGVHRACD